MENLKPVLVIGATGFLGMEICHQLVNANKKVRALVRITSDPVKVNSLKEMGIEIVTGDIKDPLSLAKACKDAGAVISTASSTLSRIQGDSIETVDRQGQLNVVEASNAANVEKFVYISFLETNEKFPLQDAKREVEKRIMQTSMDYTILRPTFFMEVWLGPYLGFDTKNRKATIYGHGVNKISWISLKDVAAFAVASLDNEVAMTSIIDLGGPEALSPLEVIRIFEEETGKFELQYVPEEVIRNQKDQSTDILEQSFAALMLNYVAGAEVPMEETLHLIPINMTTVREFSHLVLNRGELEEKV
ncbi:MAG: SDR family oxidoreductase [Flavisolibacter sp.]